MPTFSIDTDNNITAFATPEDVPSDRIGLETFTSQKELAKQTAKWPIARLAEIWNSFAGVVPFDELKPVKKFTDRKVAVNRIWQAIQKLAPAAEEGAKGAPEAAAASKDASPKKGAKKAARGAKEAKPKTARDTAAPREGSKKQIVLDLLRRKGGATMAEIAEATDWQNHSIRGFISGNLVKKMGLAVESSKNEAGDRTYHIA